MLVANVTPRQTVHPSALTERRGVTRRDFSLQRRVTPRLERCFVQGFTTMIATSFATASLLDETTVTTSLFRARNCYWMLVALVYVRLWPQLLRRRWGATWLESFVHRHPLPGRPPMRNFAYVLFVPPKPSSFPRSAGRRGGRTVPHPLDLGLLHL